MSWDDRSSKTATFARHRTASVGHHSASRRAKRRGLCVFWVRTDRRMFFHARAMYAAYVLSSNTRMGAPGTGICTVTAPFPEPRVAQPRGALPRGPVRPQQTHARARLRELAVAQRQDEARRSERLDEIRRARAPATSANPATSTDRTGVTQTSTRPPTCASPRRTDERTYEQCGS